MGLLECCIPSERSAAFWGHNTQEGPRRRTCAGGQALGSSVPGRRGGGCPRRKCAEDRMLSILSSMGLLECCVPSECAAFWGTQHSRRSTAAHLRGWTPASVLYILKRAGAGCVCVVVVVKDRMCASLFVTLHKTHGPSSSRCICPMTLRGPRRAAGRRRDARTTNALFHALSLPRSTLAREIAIESRGRRCFMLPVTDRIQGCVTSGPPESGAVVDGDDVARV